VVASGGRVVNFLGRVVDWFTLGDHWHGDFGIPHRLQEHLMLSAVAVLVALVIALPVGLGLGHIGRGGFLAINVSNIGRAIPSFGLLVFAQQLFGIGNGPAYVALVALAVPPIITNAYVAVREVDPEIKEAARGMGMSGAQQLFRVELPVALPLVMAGIRTAAVQVVATATLAALIAGGGLGRFIIDGLAVQDKVQLFAGALLVGLLSALTEVGLSFVQRLITPAGLGNERPASIVPVRPGGGMF
jgi:osmoprotectant transport system permease protein